MGASEEREAGTLVGVQAVLNVIQGMENKGHVIVVDNFFTSVSLAMALLEQGFWMTGTYKRGSKGFPPSLAGLSSKSKVNMPPRGHLSVKMHRSRQISAVCWIDNKPVWLLSTATDPVDPAARAPRWLRGHFDQRHEFPTSPILLEYQRNMRGIDVVDQQRVEYTVALASHKWWHRLLCFVVDSAAHNAYILYRHDARAVGVPVFSRLLWLYRLGMALLCPYLTPGHIRGPHRHLAPPGFHRSEGHVTLRRNCVVCGKRTRCLCNGCAGAFMCGGGCYIRVHTQPEHAATFRR
jgi:hypothetical protein